MTNDQSPKWTYPLAVVTAAAVLFAFIYSVKPEVHKASSKSTPQPWGIIERLYVGEEMSAAKKEVHGASSIRTVSLPGRLKQVTLKVKWGKGDHLLTLVFMKGRLGNAYEVRTLCNKWGQTQGRQWQAFSRSQPWTETGEL